VDRLALSASGQVRYTLEKPWRDGTTHVVLEPLDFIARLAALVPPPRRHLTRYHGAFAPNSGLRALITRSGRGKGRKGAASTAQGAEQPRRPCHVAMRWARRLKRVFGVEIDACAHCGARLKIVASIEDPGVIARILRIGIGHRAGCNRSGRCSAAGRAVLRSTNGARVRTRDSRAILRRAAGLAARFRGHSSARAAPHLRECIDPLPAKNTLLHQRVG